MTPWTREPLLKASAAFLYYRQKGASGTLWLTPPVLTDLNPNDPANPFCSQEQANEVFRELEARELIRPGLKVFIDPEAPQQEQPKKVAICVYYLDSTKDPEWVALINKKSFWSLSVTPTLDAIFGKRQALWLAILALLATHFLGTLLKNSADRLFNNYFPPSQAMANKIKSK
jgi:hypothetical protein